MMEGDADIEKAFQQLKNIRLQIYKNLSDIDTLCTKSDQLTTEIIHDYISEKERISSNQLNDTDSLSPFKTKSGNFYSSKDMTKVNCFPTRKLHYDDEQHHRGNHGNSSPRHRKGETEVLQQPDIHLPTLFTR